MPSTIYTQEQLQEECSNLFRLEAAKYPKGHFVGKSWYLRVTNKGASLVIPVGLKQIDGSWKEETISVAL